MAQEVGDTNPKSWSPEGSLMVKCWFCRGTMIWQNDFEPQDIGMAGEGIVAILTCSACDATSYCVKTVE